jgi:hypothetical protein
MKLSMNAEGCSYRAKMTHTHFIISTCRIKAKRWSQVMSLKPTQLSPPRATLPSLYSQPQAGASSCLQRWQRGRSSRASIRSLRTSYLQGRRYPCSPCSATTTIGSTVKVVGAKQALALMTLRRFCPESLSKIWQGSPLGRPITMAWLSAPRAKPSSSKTKTRNSR